MKNVFIITCFLTSCIVFGQDDLNQVLVADTTSHGPQDGSSTYNGVTAVDIELDDDTNSSTDGSNEYRVGIYAEPNIEPSAQLQIDSKDKGLLVTLAETATIDTTSGGTTTEGMLTYDPIDDTFYFKSSTSWVAIQ